MSILTSRSFLFDEEIHHKKHKREDKNTKYPFVLFVFPFVLFVVKSSGWQVYIHGSSLTLFALHFDLSAMFFDDLLGDHHS
jgi:hypothetical protein